MKKSSFIKRYLLGFAASIFVTLAVYLSLIISPYTISPLLLGILVLAPAVACIVYLWKKERLGESYSLDQDQVKIILVCVVLLFFIARGILTNSTLFMSNGTYFYSKYYAIVSSVGEYGQFPFYWPNSAQGEHLFIGDAPGFFSHIAFISLLLSWIPPVLFFNSYSFFLLFMVMMGVTALLQEALPERKGNITPYLVALVACGIVLNFIFVQFLESVKQFFAQPIGLLIITIILSESKRFEDYAIVGVIWGLMLTLHPAQSIGTALLAACLVILMRTTSPERGFAWVGESFRKNKVVSSSFLIVVVVIPLFYVLPLIEYSPFMRHADVPLQAYTTNALSYLKSFIVDQNPLSVSNPDVRRIDDKKIGAFFSLLGLVGVGVSLLFWKNPGLRKANILFLAFVLHIVGSAIVVSVPFINNVEYGHRTVIPYLLVVSLVVTGVVITQLGRKILYGGAALLVVGLVLTLPEVKQNLENIHGESMIGGQSFRDEIDFIKKLPIDGRIITYGYFGNAVDPGLAALTGRYLSRYEFKQFDFSRMLYEDIHSSNSWGSPEYFTRFSPLELVNKLKVGGYKYLFLNICHPTGQAVAEIVYPQFSFAIYQNQCNVMLVLNNTAYAEKVNVVSKEEEEQALEQENGFLNYAISPEYSWYGYDGEVSKRVTSFSPVDVIRISPSEVELRGKFSEGDWVVFKEQYFPRWKALMGDIQLEVTSTTHYLLMVKAKEGTSIFLKNDALPIERSSAALSLLGIVICLLLLALQSANGAAEAKENGSGIPKLFS